MSRYSKYVNDDGLAVGYGTHSADNDTGSVFSGSGSTKELVLKLDLKQLPTVSQLQAGTIGDEATINISAAGYFSNAPIIPANSSIVSARIVTDVIAAGTNANLNVGTYRMGSDGLLNLVVDDNICDDGDGDVAGFAAIGDAVVCTGALTTAATAQVGVNDVIIAATSDTAFFTAGEVTVTILYRTPKVSISPAA